MPALAAALALQAAALLPPGWSALCPKPEPGEVVVCADREPPAAKWRLPMAFPREFGERGTASVSRERNALLGPDVGTIGNCNNVGPGGWTGCSYQSFKQNVQQAAGSRDPRGRVYEGKP